MPSISAFLFLTIAILISGCQSDPAKDFAQIHPGMEKRQVLYVMGSPQRSQRWHGLDRWTYIFPETPEENATNLEKEVHFNEGKATYVGEKFKPAISAEEQDIINETENAQVAKEAAARRQETHQQFQRFQEESTGENEIRYVPTYEPVR